MNRNEPLGMHVYSKRNKLIIIIVNGVEMLQK